MSKFLTWIPLLANLGPRVEPYPQKLADFTAKPEKKEPKLAEAPVENKDTYIRVDEEDIRRYRSLIG